MDKYRGMADDLMALTAVVEAGGFAAASHRFGIPVSRLSRRVAALEERMGVSLVVRSSRKFKVTDIGASMVEHGNQMRAALDDAMTAVHSSAQEPLGPLHICCPGLLAAQLVTPLAIQFMRQYPRVTVILDSTDGRPGSTSRPADLLIQPSTRPLPDSLQIARRLYAITYRLMAAPELAERLGPDATPEGLREIPAIGWTFQPHPARWQLHGANGEERTVDVPLRFVADSLQNIRQAAVAGIGIAQMPPVLSQADVEAGRLRIVLPDWTPPVISIYALYPSRRDLSFAGRKFLDLLSDAANARAIGAVALGANIPVSVERAS